MKNVRWIAVAALALAAPAARATNGMRIIGFGPVQNGMGGASIAAPLDAATVITNPAGMTAVGGRLDFGASYFAPTVKFSATGAASGREMTSDRGPSPIPALGFVMQKDDRLSVGIGAYGVAGLGVDYAAELYGQNLFTAYSQMRFAPGAAYRVLDDLSVGAVANVMYATMEYNVAGMYPRDTSQAFGLGATLGVQYTPVPTVTVGAAYETRSFFQNFKFNIPAHTSPMGDVPGGVEELEFDQPSVATLGVAFRPLEALVLAADVAWIRWSETNGEDLPDFQTDPALTGMQPWSLNWDDQVVVKVGAQYAATDWLKVRAGYEYGKQPLDERRNFENVAFPAISEHHVTAGLGATLGKAEVNVAAQWVPEVTLEGSTPSAFITSYETKLSQYAIDLGVAYRF
jgi:long-chain fatty acid transport protein